MSELALPRPAAAELPRGERLLSDELLAKLVGRGSARAFAALYERHHQALYRYCRSIVRDEHDAQDALQAAMTQAYAALRAKERDLAVRAWLFRIAHNESISLLRKRGRDAPLGDRSDAVGPDLQDAVETRARLSELVTDLHELPERQRSALIMRELSGLSLEEIAGALSISTAGAKQALFEARNSLREIKEGREMVCERVREALSAHDGRVLRGRRIKSHLRACEDCRTFRAAIGTREADLRLLAPALPASIAATILGRLLGGGAHLSGGGGAAAAGSSLANAGTGGPGASLLGHVGSSLVAKGIAGVAIVALATAGTARLATTGFSRHTGKGSELRTGGAHQGTGAGQDLVRGGATSSGRPQAAGGHGSANGGGEAAVGGGNASAVAGHGRSHAGAQAPSVSSAQGHRGIGQTVSGAGRRNGSVGGAGSAGRRSGGAGRRSANSGRRSGSTHRPSGSTRRRSPSHRTASSGQGKPAAPRAREPSHPATGGAGTVHTTPPTAAGEAGELPTRTTTTRASGSVQPDSVQGSPVTR